MNKSRIKSVLLTLIATCCISFSLPAAGSYTPPANNRIKYNLNYDWKFFKGSTKVNDGVTAPESVVTFNDAAWLNVSLPHTYNDIDLYDTWITSGGYWCWANKAWYRKHFKLDAALAGRKVIVEFEGIRQAGEVYINGTWVGRHENGVTPGGMDISNYVHFGAEENILAVRTDNSLGYKEVSTQTSFVWNTTPFNPNYGGIVSNANLWVMDKMYQTLPLYRNLGTSGTYIYAENINPLGKTATVTVETEVKNDYPTSQTIDYEVDIVDRNGNQVGTQSVTANSVAAGATKKITASVALTGVELWNPEYPYLYKVYTILKSGGRVIDVYDNTFGIRKVTWNVTDGLLINGSPLYLNGFAPRSTMEWVSVGKAPNWLEEYDFKMMKEAYANFLRPMHTAPHKQDVDAANNRGIIYACPAGDAEGDAFGVQWTQRVELMRDVTIYFRNNPSIVFWEAGNANVMVAHMQDMVDVRNTWDPKGGRYCGTRSSNDSLGPIVDYYGSMDNPATSSLHPLWDAEFARAECPRRVWDKYSPPSFGYKNIANPANSIQEYPVNDFRLNSSEDLARNNVWKYWTHWSKRGGQGLPSISCGGAKIIFADGVSHGRMEDTEVARVSGTTDGARLPKQSYYAMKVVHNPNPDLHIIGHWSYPAKTVKTVCVISNTEEVQLITYDNKGKLIKDYGKGVRTFQFDFAFASVEYKVGKIKAIGFNSGVVVAQDSIITAGTPKSLKLSSIVGPNGFVADGSDIAMFDVEVVDSVGRRCPTQESKVNFTYSGQGTYLGGYNSGIEMSIFQNYLNVECGINRVFVRANRTAGDFTLNVTAPGLTSATAKITSKPFTVTNGLTTEIPQSYSVVLVKKPVDQFAFEDTKDVDLSVEITSPQIVLSGITSPQPIKIVASSGTATYSINGAAFTALAGTVSNGDKVAVKIMSDNKYLSATYAKIDVGGVSDIFSVTTKAAPPVEFNLAYLKPINASSTQGTSVASNSNDGDVKTRWAASGGGYPQAIGVNLGAVYSIDHTEILPDNDRDYQFLLEGSLDSIHFYPLSDQTKSNLGLQTIIATKFPAQNAKYVRLTFTGSTVYTGNWATIYEFRVFEAPKDLIPDQFKINEVKNAELFDEYISDPITITGIEGPSDISLSNQTEVADYSVNGGPFTSDPGKVNNNDVVKVRLGTGSQNSNTYSVRLTVGGIWADFKVTTKEFLDDIEKLNQLNQLSFYPNPTTGVVKMSEIQEAGNLEIYNLAGQIIKKDVLMNTNNYQINLSKFQPGLYMVKFSTNSKAYHGQIILK